MGNNNKNVDWKEQLKNLGKQLKEEMTPEEKLQEEQEERQKSFNIQETNRRKPRLYQFLAGYKQNSGILINNFFRKRDYKMYCEDKFHSFTFNFHGSSLPNVFDDFSFSMKMVKYLGELEKNEIAYFPIDVDFIEHLINLAIVMDLSKPLEEDTVFYRGCSTIDRNGVNGLVSITSDYRIAEQFSRGTILKITVPKGTKLLNVNAIRPKEQRRKDLEQEYLLSPCDYEIVGQEIKDRADEPNNRRNKTLHLDLKVKPLDLLEEFYRVMCKPPEEYYPVYLAQEGKYEKAFDRLEYFIETRNRKTKNNPELIKQLRENK